MEMFDWPFSAKYFQELRSHTRVVIKVGVKKNPVSFHVRVRSFTAFEEEQEVQIYVILNSVRVK